MSYFIKSDDPEQVMFENSAVWHKSCRLRYSKTKGELLVHAVDRKNPISSIQDVSSAETRTSGSQSGNSNKDRETKCIFCDAGDEESSLHRIRTMNAD